jgi:hypothetical protein
MKLDLTAFKNALGYSVIQRFEFTYELRWKFLSRHLALELEAKTVDRFSRRDLYRVGAERRPLSFE